MWVVFDEGVDIVNDIWVLCWDGVLQVVVLYFCCGVCLMYMYCDLQIMQIVFMDGDVLLQVICFFEQWIDVMYVVGVVCLCIVLDFGIGFGKMVVQNFSLFVCQIELFVMGVLLLVGWFCKLLFGSVSNQDVFEKCVFVSVVVVLLVVECGVYVVWVYDVCEMVDVLVVLVVLGQLFFVVFED